jgi:hypothetical protein
LKLTVSAIGRPPILISKSSIAASKNIVALAKGQKRAKPCTGGRATFFL